MPPPPPSPALKKYQSHIFSPKIRNNSISITNQFFGYCAFRVSKVSSANGVLDIIGNVPNGDTNYHNIHTITSTTTTTHHIIYSKNMFYHPIIQSPHPGWGSRTTSQSINIPILNEIFSNGIYSERIG